MPETTGTGKALIAPDNTVTTDDAATYEKIAKLLGRAMDGAWSKFVKDLAGGDANAFSPLLTNGKSVTTAELATFCRLLGGANMSLDLPCRLTKGDGMWFSANEVAVVNANPVEPNALGVDVSISVGVSVRF